MRVAMPIVSEKVFVPSDRAGRLRSPCFGGGLRAVDGLLQVQRGADNDTRRALPEPG